MHANDVVINMAKGSILPLLLATCIGYNIMREWSGLSGRGSCDKKIPVMYSINFSCNNYLLLARRNEHTYSNK